MKMKSFAILATSGLLAAGLSYGVPALADDTSTSGQSMQQSSPSDNNAQNPSTDTSQGNSSSSDMNNNSGTSNTDEGTPERDSATGDDDY